MIALNSQPSQHPNLSQQCVNDHTRTPARRSAQGGSEKEILSLREQLATAGTHCKPTPTRPHPRTTIPPYLHDSQPESTQAAAAAECRWSHTGGPTGSATYNPWHSWLGNSPRQQALGRVRRSSEVHHRRVLTGGRAMVRRRAQGAVDWIGCAWARGLLTAQRGPSGSLAPHAGMDAKSTQP
jgi:hypothetical protein